MSHPGNVPSGSPYTIPPEPTLSQNPLSIMMSRMSKFAMPSSTPLYHDAIKTVASSDDDSPPARSPNLPSMNNNGSPYTIPPEPTLSQNPLSIMMSRMSKFAMPSSTPLYHDAIKTVASSDDDSPPARSPNLPSMNNNAVLPVR
ncbi:hypothetical protein CRUP_015958 [Coryphaenoides rupestris]|nr:hypothetical protein CRUP_015958 [Coryphaenoides rupestris]